MNRNSIVAVVVALLVGVGVGALVFAETKTEVKTVVKEVTVEVTPPACLEAIDGLLGVGSDLSELWVENLEAILAGDLYGISAVTDQLGVVLSDVESLTPVVADCRSKASGGVVYN